MTPLAAPPAASAPRAPTIPLGPLSRDVVEPTAYTVELSVTPGEEYFTGHARIDLDLKRRGVESFYLHGHGLEVTKALLTAGDGADIPVTYEEVHEDGVAKVTLAREAVRGPATTVSGPITPLIRPAHFVPETKRVPDLLKEFQRKRLQSAIVVDEYK